MKRTVERLRTEFLEMPGLRLTPRQVQRLCGVEGTVSKAALDRLTEERFLFPTENGAYGRAGTGPGGSAQRSRGGIQSGDMAVAS
jgi:hypothetical protein